MNEEQLKKLNILLEENPESINQAIDEQGNTWLHMIAEVNDTESLKLILSNSSPNFFIENNEGYTCWHVAVINGHLACLQFIYSNVNKIIDFRTGKGEDENVNQFTALHLAILHKHFDVIHWLVENKANINAVVLPSQEHSLYIAGKLKFVSIVKYLLDAGALIPDYLPRDLAYLYKKDRPNDEGFTDEELEIIGAIGFYEQLHCYVTPENYPSVHFNYATRFLSQDYTMENYPKIIPSLRNLVMTKIHFFNTYTEKKIKLDILSIDLQNLYFNLAKSWMNNTSSRPEKLANFFYSEVKQRLSELLEFDLPYSHTNSIGQYFETTLHQIGNTLKQLAAIHKNKKINSETKLKLFDDELMTLIQELNRKESENKGIKEKNLHKELSEFLKRKETVADWGYKLNLFTKLEVLKTFVKNLGQQAGAEYIVANSNDKTCNVM